MVRFVQKHARLFFAAFHLGEALACALLIAVVFWQLSGISMARAASLYLVFEGVLFASYFVLACRLGLFQSMRLMTLRQEIKRTFIVYTLSVALAFMAASFLRLIPEGFDRHLILASAAGGAGLIGYHLATRKVLRVIRRRGYDHKVAVCVGINPQTLAIARAIRRWPEMGIDLVGVFDAPDRKAGLTFAPYLGNLEDIAEFVRTQIVDIVFITLPVRSHYDDICRLVQVCSEVGIEVRYQLGLAAVPPYQTRTTVFAGQPFVTFDETSLSASALSFKRAVDLLVASILLVLCGPIMLLAALAIRLTSGSPVLFRQMRVGYHGRRFVLLKFRTMVLEAEKHRTSLEHLNEVGGPAFKMRDDPRITLIGRILRRFSIDELPQLLNVLRGDMSLVGPRPPLPEEVAQYEWAWRRRLSLRPGLTCTWQISGRNEIGFEDWMEMDLDYIDHWSPLLDLKILVLTFPAVLLGRGAY